MPYLRRKNTLKKSSEDTKKTLIAPVYENPENDDSVIGPDELKMLMSDQWWRLNNLYYVKNKSGEKVKFKPWDEQVDFYFNMHYLNVILKARQRGITTIVQIFMLDCCLFNSNINAGVIAHNREDAQKFFDDKIKFAYDNLTDDIKRAISAESNNTNELTFSNGSGIRVGTSMRSGTLQYLHVSEYGKICAKYPDKADEIKSGSLNTVAPGNFVFIESTAEGAHGHFYELSTEAEKTQQLEDCLTDLDYKFFFYPWYQAPEYTLNANNVIYSDEQILYFNELEKEHGIVLSEGQKNWYVKKSKEQGDKMQQEYPSTPDEAFRGITEGAVYGKQMRAVRKERRITDVPYLDGTPVNTFWDIGRDMTFIWFHQRVGGVNRFFHCYHDDNMSLPDVAKILLQDLEYPYHKYLYGKHYLPHDIGVTDLTAIKDPITGELPTRKKTLENNGIKPVVAVPRIPYITEGIEMTRQALSTCWFDKNNCAYGIKSLENYRYKFDIKLETFQKEPLHNWASHGSDALRQYAQGYKHVSYDKRSEDVNNPLTRYYRNKKRSKSSDWRV